MNLRSAAGGERSESRGFRSGRLTAGIAWSATVLVAALALAGTALAQSSGGPYTLDPQSVAGGGGRSTGGSFALEGTIGRHDASNVLGGGAFELTGGFHQRAQGALGDALFGDGFEGP